MSLLHNNPSVIVKKKNLSAVFEYCTEHKIESKFVPREMPDEWEVEFVISDVLKAISLGMFLKENRMDLVGMSGFGTSVSKQPSPVHASKSRARKTDKEDKSDSPAPIPSTPTPMFDQNEDVSKQYPRPIGNEDALF
ncbi:MAG: hypothetical protein IAE67_02635 [Candidatus Competibacteraceae bacterium]|nr:hypothetical protein [Candidatus Competibacteraceae bacterium]